MGFVKSCWVLRPVRHAGAENLEVSETRLSDEQLVS